MWLFLKRLLEATYDNTVGAIVRLVHNTQRATVDETDHSTLKRIVIYIGYVVFGLCLPSIAVFLTLFRLLAVLDVIGTIASVFKDTANSYA